MWTTASWMPRSRGAGRGSRQRGPAPGFAPPGAGEEGFSVVETTVAVGVVFLVLLGLLASINVGVRGVLTGRQRTGGVALAKEIVERARAVPYDELGHDVSGDATLAADPRIGGTAPHYTYHPEGAPAPERLVAAADPHFRVHEWSEVRDGTTYTARVYVTWVEGNPVGDDFKRLTVEVRHESPQYDAAAVPNLVRLSTFFSVGGQAVTAPGGGAGGAPGGDGGGGSGAFPTARGVVDVDGGTVEVTGTLAGIDLNRATVSFASAHQDATGQILREAHGSAETASSRLVLNRGGVSGPDDPDPDDDEADDDGLDDDGDGVDTTVACVSQRAQTVTDNDGGTPAPVHAVDGPYSARGCTVATSPGVPQAGLNLALGDTAEVVSRTSVESCLTCWPVVGDGDRLMYGQSQAQMPGVLRVGFESGVLSGDLVRGGSGTSPGDATASFDADPVNDHQLVTTSGHFEVAALDVLTLTGGPLGFEGAVRVGAAEVTATAQAGPTAAAPSAGGGALTVDVYETNALGLGSYRRLTVTPGVPMEETARASFGVPAGGSSVAVTIETTVRTTGASTTCEPSCASIERASASLDNWLVVAVHVVATAGTLTLADLTVEVDYGSVRALAEYDA